MELVTQEALFSDTELEALIRALARGQREFTEEDAMIVINWAMEIRVGATLLAMAIKGRTNLSVHEGEVCASHREKIVSS